MSSLFGIGKDKDKDKKKKEDGAAKADPEEDGEHSVDGGDKKEESGKGEICQMKRGDYMIHVYVEQAKNLKIEGDSTVDPIVEVVCMGERKYTTAQNDINNSAVAIWNEHLFYEPKNKEVEDLENAKVEIKLMDKGFFKDALIGYYEFDLSYIYQMKDHAMLHKWIIMSNPESEDYGEVTGQLKLSITICGEGDEQIGIQDDPHPEKEEVIQPPQIKPEFYQVRFRFFVGQRIVPMDTAIFGEGSTDAYVKLDYKTTKLKTKKITVKETEDAHWNEEFLVPAQLPLIGGRIVFKLYDYDLTSDELIGAMNFDMKDILPDSKGNKGKMDGVYDWKNVKGAPLGVSGKISDAMNQNPEIASLWKGRILVQCTCEKTDKPLLKVEKIDDELVEDSKPALQNRSFAFQCQVISLLTPPKDNEEFRVGVRIADKEWKTKKNKELSKDQPSLIVKEKYNRFNQWLTQDEREFRMPYRSIKDMETIYVYLYMKSFGHEKRVCYWAGNITDFMNPNPQIKWIEMEPDLAIGTVTQREKAGIIGIKMAIHDVTANGPIDWEEYPAWSVPLRKRPKLLKVRVFCWQARDLPAADDSGSSDPFLMITDACSEKSHRTQVIWDNVNPLFYEGVDTVYEINSKEEMPPIIVDVYDKDENIIGSDSEDFLARATLYIQNMKDCVIDAFDDPAQADVIPRPSWHNLYYKKGGAISGEVLLSFVITQNDYSFKRTLPQLNMEGEVNMAEFGVQMNILGLRGLMSPGLLPVKKAFLQFNLKSMVPPKLGANLANIRTEPKMPGTDPTLNTLLDFNAPLPTDTLFCPRMSCNVYDNIAMGFSQPLIGTFVVPIGELMHDLRKEREEETAALQNVVDQVRRFVLGDKVAGYFKKMLNAKIDEANAIREKELKEQQVKDAMKATLQRKLIKPRADEEEDDAMGGNSNAEASVPLLSGDHDEETRMSERIEEARIAGVEGANERITAQQIEQVSQALQDERRTQSRLNSQLRTLSNNMSVDGEGNQIQKFDPKLKQELLALQVQKVAKRRLKNEEERKKAEANFENCDNLIMPKYRLDEKMCIDREYDCPPEQMFIGLGWDEDATTQRRHYRRYYPDELENCTDVLPIPSPFNQYNLKRGKSRGAKASFWQTIRNNYKTDASGSVSTEKVVGRFKAIIEVEDREFKKAYFKKKHELIDKLVENLKLLAKNREIKDFDLNLDKLESMEGRAELKQMLEPLEVNHLMVVEKLADIESDMILKRMLLQNAKMIVRIYIIEGFDLASRDIGGFSDPYIRLKLGDKTVSDRKNYIMDEPNPKFCKHWDFETHFPGCPMLFIDAMDYDELFGDDLIGTTTVDLEDRYFLPEWRAIQNKPVEYRQIYHPSSSVSQGQLKLWVEINNASVPDEDRARVWDISQKPPLEFQVRVCIFDTRDIKMMDDEGTSDVFIRCYFDSRKDALETDTHWRCQTGQASFNYRLNFKVEWPRKDYRFTVQAYDRDFFKSNDVIGSAMIDLKQAFDDAELTKRPLQINKDYYDEYMRKEDDKPLEWDKEGESFWLPMIARGETGELEDNGHVRVRIDITTMEYAETNKIGHARTDPNMEPYLPPPIGRISFTLNPCEMYKQLIGPAMRRKIAIWCAIITCAVLCCLILYYLVPIIIGNLITNALIRVL